MTQVQPQAVTIKLDDARQVSGLLRRRLGHTPALCWPTVRGPACLIHLWRALQTDSLSAASPLFAINFLTWSKGQSVQMHPNWLKQRSVQLWSTRLVSSQSLRWSQVANRMAAA